MSFCMVEKVPEERRSLLFALGFLFLSAFLSSSCLFCWLSMRSLLNSAAEDMNEKRLLSPLAALSLLRVPSRIEDSRCLLEVSEFSSSLTLRRFFAAPGR